MFNSRPPVFGENETDAGETAAWGHGGWGSRRGYTLGESENCCGNYPIGVHIKH